MDQYWLIPEVRTDHGRVVMSAFEDPDYLDRLAEYTRSIATDLAIECGWSEESEGLLDSCEYVAQAIEIAADRIRQLDHTRKLTSVPTNETGDC